MRTQAWVVATAHKHGREELPHVRGQGQRPRVPGCDGAGMAEKSYPSPRSRAVAGRSYSASEVRGCGQEPGTHAWTPLPVSGPDSRLNAVSQEKPWLPPQTVPLLALRKARCHVRCPKMWPKCSGTEGCLQQTATKTPSGTTHKEPSPANHHVNKPGGQSCPSEAFIWTADSLNTTSSETLS